MPTPTAPRLRIVTALMFMLTGCGFHLRGDVDLPQVAKTIYLEGADPSQPFSQEFTELYSFAGGYVSPDRGAAGAIVRIVRTASERRQISLSKGGKANAFDLIYRIEYEVTTPSGEVLVPKREIEISREYFNDQRFPLGQGEQEQQMRNEMQQEAAQRLLRQLRFAVKSGAVGKT